MQETIWSPVLALQLGEVLVRTPSWILELSARYMRGSEVGSALPLASRANSSSFKRTEKGQLYLVSKQTAYASFLTAFSSLSSLASQEANANRPYIEVCEVSGLFCLKLVHHIARHLPGRVPEFS